MRLEFESGRLSIFGFSCQNISARSLSPQQCCFGFVSCFQAGHPQVMCSLHMLVISAAVCLMHICCNCSVTTGGFCKMFSTTMQLQPRTVATVAKTDRAFHSLAVLGKYASKFKRAKDALTTAVPNLNPTDASIMSTWMDLDGHGEPLKLAVN